MNLNKIPFTSPLVRVSSNGLEVTLATFHPEPIVVRRPRGRNGEEWNLYLAKTSISRRISRDLPKVADELRMIAEIELVRASLDPRVLDSHWVSDLDAWRCAVDSTELWELIGFHHLLITAAKFVIQEANLGQLLAEADKFELQAQELEDASEAAACAGVLRAIQEGVIAAEFVDPKILQRCATLRSVAPTKRRL